MRVHRNLNTVHIQLLVVFSERSFACLHGVQLKANGKLGKENARKQP